MLVDEINEVDNTEEMIVNESSHICQTKQYVEVMMMRVEY